MATPNDFRMWNDETERDALVMALHGVTELHVMRHYYNFEGTTVMYCDHCTEVNGGRDVLWPCDTMKAVEKSGVVTE